MGNKAKELLKKYYGYDSFRKGQEKIINSILNRNDTVAIMPTGAGKSICFQIPALIFEGVTIVISPLISLMKDQVDSLSGIGISGTFINSTLSQREIDERLDEIKRGQYKIIYLAPERLESEEFLRFLNNINVSFVAIDEAHCVSKWGHDFRPSYRLIGKMIDSFDKRPVIAGFTATATEEVKDDIVKLLHLKKPEIYITGFDRENLFFSCIRDENKKDFVLRYVEDNKNLSGIIYAATRKEVDNLYTLLNKKGYSAARYHAGMKDEERASSQESFLFDNTKIMVATNAFGMGIDKSNVRYVIHFNMPKDMESYYQEAGRAGRDGEPSECILLFSPQDTMLQRFLIEKTVLSPERRDNELKKLQTMVDYCHTQRCLRKFILEYFGENEVAENCNNCSNCRNDAELSDITLEAQKIFSCILRMRGKYGITLVADVLKGSKNRKVLEYNFDKLSTYGIMGEYSEKEIKDIINLLISEGYLYLSGAQYPVVKLKDKAAGVLNGSEKVYQRITRRAVKAEEDNSLFELLKAKRHEISQRENVPPYIIFSDSTLHDMEKNCPVDYDSMLKIKGVGETKFEKYGDEFICVIKEYLKEKGMGTERVNDASPVKEEKDEKIPSHIVSLNLYKGGKTIKEIAAIRNLNEVTIQNHIIRCFDEGIDVDLSPLIPEKYEGLIVEKIRKLGSARLKPIKDALPDEVDYMAIKAVLSKIAK